MPDEFSFQRVSGSDFIKVLGGLRRDPRGKKEDESFNLRGNYLAQSSASFATVNFARFYEAAITAISRDILRIIITRASNRLKTLLPITSAFSHGYLRVFYSCKISEN